MLPLRSTAVYPALLIRTMASPARPAMTNWPRVIRHDVDGWGQGPASVAEQADDHMSEGQALAVVVGLAAEEAVTAADAHGDSSGGGPRVVSRRYGDRTRGHGGYDAAGRDGRDRRVAGLECRSGAGRQVPRRAIGESPTEQECLRRAGGPKSRTSWRQLERLQRDTGFDDYRGRVAQSTVSRGDGGRAVGDAGNRAIRGNAGDECVAGLVNRAADRRRQVDGCAIGSQARDAQRPRRVDNGEAQKRRLQVDSLQLRD